MVDIPVWNGGMTKARVNQVKANLERLNTMKELLAKQIRLQVQKAYLNLKEAESRINIADRSVEQARENLRIVKGSYKLGKTISRDVIDAQLTLIQAQTNYIEVLIDVKLAKAFLDRITSNNIKPEN